MSQSDFRLQMVYEACEVLGQGGCKFTMRQVARALGHQPSTYLLSSLYLLEQRCLLTRRIEERPNGTVRCLFMINPIPF